VESRPITIGRERVELCFDDDYGSSVSDPFEPVTTAVLERWCEPGTVALDVGANIGCTAILLSQIASKVHAFEALPSTCDVLEQNARRNGNGRISVHRFGLGDEPGTFTFTRSATNRSGAFVDNIGGDLEHHVSEVGEIRTLDSMTDFGGRVGFVKIDVEGFELHVLRGARRFLEEHRPTVVMEMNHYCLNVFQRMTVPDFLDELRATFPTLLAVDRHTLGTVDLHDPSPAYFAVHEHITQFNYDTLVGIPA
jgi:FkbM family methyltransferase